MRIGVEINGVLRNTIDKIEKTYQKFLSIVFVIMINLLT